MKLPKQTAPYSLLLARQTADAALSLSPSNGFERGDVFGVLPQAARIAGGLLLAGCALFAFPFSHDYQVSNIVCVGTNDMPCVAEEVLENVVLRNAALAVPGGRSRPFTSGDTHFVWTNNLPFISLPAGFVTTEVDRGNLTIRNITRPLHIFYRGQVERQFIQEGNNVRVITRGTGRGLFGLVNQLAGPSVFDQLDSDIAKVLQERQGLVLGERDEVSL